MILQGYWVSQLDPRIKAGVLNDWADTLEDWPLPHIKLGLREWRAANPDKRPNPEHISQILKRKRGEAEAKRRAEQQRHEQTPPATLSEEERKERAEMAARIMAEAGFASRMHVQAENTAAHGSNEDL